MWKHNSKAHFDLWSPLNYEASIKAISFKPDSCNLHNCELPVMEKFPREAVTSKGRTMRTEEPETFQSPTES